MIVWKKNVFQKIFYLRKHFATNSCWIGLKLWLRWTFRHFRIPSHLLLLATNTSSYASIAQSVRRWFSDLVVASSIPHWSFFQFLDQKGLKLVLIVKISKIRFHIWNQHHRISQCAKLHDKSPAASRKNIWQLKCPYASTTTSAIMFSQKKISPGFISFHLVSPRSTF